MGQSRIVVLSASTDTGGRYTRFFLIDTYHPGFTFALTMAAGVMVGLEAYGDGDAAGSKGVIEVREQGKVLVPPADARPVTARLLRRLPIREMEQAVRQHLRGVLFSPELGALVAKSVRRAPERPGGRARTWSDRAIAEVCADYVSLCEIGEPRPMRRLAEHHYRNEKTIRNVVSKARDGGFLTRAPAGRAGGQLTEKARKVLNGVD